MANRRMINKQIVTTDKFIELPITAQCLYFHLIILADDDGFIGNPKTVSRMLGASSEELQILVNQNYLIDFDSGVVVITDWFIHNLIRTDRHKETMYIDEKKLLTQNESKQYQRLEDDDNQVTTKRQPSANQMEPQVRLGKVRLGKVSINKNHPPKSPQGDGEVENEAENEIEDEGEIKKSKTPKTPKTSKTSTMPTTSKTPQGDELFEKFWKSYPKKRSKTTAIKAFNKLSVDENLLAIMLQSIELAKQTPQWRKDNGQFIPYPATWLNAGGWQDEIDCQLSSTSKLDRQMQLFDEIEQELRG